MTAQWFYGREGQQNGPVSTEQLKQLVVSGQVQPTDLIWKEGMASWAPATQLDQLAAAESPSLGATASAQQIAAKASTQFDKLTGGRVKATWAKIAIAVVAALILLWIAASLAPLVAIGGGIALAYYWKRLAKPARWAGIGGVAFLLIIWAGSREHADVTTVKTGHLSAQANVPAGTAGSTLSNGPTANASASGGHRINDEFQLGDYKYRITGVRQQRSVGNEFVGKRAGSGAKFVIVSYLIENCTKKTQTVLSEDFTLLDSKGREFRPSSDVNTALLSEENKDFLLSELQPGVPRSMTIGFEVPESTSISDLTLIVPKKGLFSNGEVKVRLTNQ